MTVYLQILCSMRLAVGVLLTLPAGVAAAFVAHSHGVLSSPELLALLTAASGAGAW